MPAASRQEGRAGDGPRAWPNGPEGPGPARRGGDTFLLNSPRFPAGDGRGTKHETGSEATHHFLLPGREPPR